MPGCACPSMAISFTPSALRVVAASLYAGTCARPQRTDRLSAAARPLPQHHLGGGARAGPANSAHHAMHACRRPVAGRAAGGLLVVGGAHH
eukprot:4769890-Prymnesium_polylepis.1